MRSLILVLMIVSLVVAQQKSSLAEVEMKYTPTLPEETCHLPQEWEIDCHTIRMRQQELLDMETASYDIFDMEPGSEDSNSTNWFYYRDFLTGMDDFYDVGTEAVIIMASKIDYGLYHFFDEDTNATLDEDDNTTYLPIDANYTMTDIRFTDDEENSSIGMYIQENEDNTSSYPSQIETDEYEYAKQTYWMSRWFDMDSKNAEFLNLTDESYVRLRGGYAYDFRGEGKFIHSITAKLKIPRTKDKLDLIIGDETRRSRDLNFDGTENETDTGIAIGAENLTGLFDVVKSRVRVGFSGFTDPFAKWTLKYEKLVGPWFIEPSQNVRYSRDNQLEEWTDLYFKRTTSSDKMFSLLMQRSTESAEPGMAYLIQPAHHHALPDKASLTVYLGLYGRTKAFDEEEDGYAPKRGIHTYSLGVSWRKQSSRKYLVYDLQPIITFEDRYGFEPNYILKATVEFYLGLRE